MQLNEVVKIKSLIPGVIVKGTKVEMENLKEILDINNIKANVIKI